MSEQGVVPEDTAEWPESHVSADQLLSRVLDLVRTTHDPAELTHARVESAIQLPMLEIDDTAVGHAAWLTPRWFYWFEFEEGPRFWPTFVLRFTSPDDENASMTGIATIDFEQFAAALIDAGFERDEDRGELGEILSFEFRRDKMLVEIATRSENPQAPDLMTHACIRSIAVG
jgi:hypothetical protein